MYSLVCKIISNKVNSEYKLKNMTPFTMKLGPNSTCMDDPKVLSIHVEYYMF